MDAEKHLKTGSNSLIRRNNGIFRCAPIRSRIDPETARRLYDDGLTDKEIGVVFCVSESAARYWRQANKLPPNSPKKKEKENYLADPKQCKQCIYHKPLAGGWNGICACHHLLETGKRREYENGVCLSQKKRRRKCTQQERD